MRRSDPRRRLPYLLALALATATATRPVEAAAPTTPLLVVERAADRAGRDRLLRRFAAQRVTLVLTGASVRELATALRSASGGLDFVAVAKSGGLDAVAPIDLELRQAPMTTVLSVLTSTTDLRFVYRAGLVMIRPADEVKEWTFLKVYDVRAATAKVPDFPGPRLGLGRGDDGFTFEEESEPRSLSGFDTDELRDLVMAQAVPESWDADTTSIDAMRGLLTVRQTESGHRAVLEVLIGLGAVQPPLRVRARPRDLRGLPRSRRIWIDRIPYRVR